MQIILIFVLLVSVISSEPLRAIAVLKNDANGINGIVTFQEICHGIKISGNITGLPRGQHGFHVHQFGDISAADCSSAGPHFNPYNQTHGGPLDSIRHVGDLGNINVTSSTTIFVFTDKIISLAGVKNIIGRSIVVHSDRDDLGKGGYADSKTTGHSGVRIACGVIGSSQ